MFLFRSQSLTEQCTSWLILFLFITDPGLTQVKGNLAPRHLVNGALGQSITLPINIPGAEPVIITWDFTNPSTGRKIQVCTKARNNPAKCNNKVGERLRLNLNDYSLEIQTLIKSDHGLYEVNGRSEQDVYEEVVELRVYERVSSPGIRISDVSSNGICNVSLSCSVENGNDLIYSWWRRGEEVTADGSHSVTDSGRRLAVTLNLHNTSTVYNCTVRNPVSEESWSVDLARACNLTNKGSGREKGDGTLHSAQILGIRAAIFMVAVIITVTGVCIWERRTVEGN